MKTKTLENSSSFDVISSFEADPFVGHLSTPITSSQITKTYLGLLPAYQKNLSPLLRGISIGFAHGYFLLGPFVELGPLRHSQVAFFIGFVSTVSLIVILTACLVVYGIVSFSDSDNSVGVDFLTSRSWRQFTSGFILGGFTGVSFAYLLLDFFNSTFN